MLDQVIAGVARRRRCGRASERGRGADQVRRYGHATYRFCRQAFRRKFRRKSKGFLLYAAQPCAAANAPAKMLLS